MRGCIRDRFTRPDARDSRNGNRFRKLDPDIAPREFDDYDPNPVRGHGGGRLNGNGNHKNRGTGKLGMLKASASGRDQMIVSQIKVVNGKTYGLPWIFKQIGSRVEDFKPILPTIDAYGNVFFYIKSEEHADAISALNRRIRHPMTDSLIKIFKNESVAPWKKLSHLDVDLINTVIDSRYSETSRALDLNGFGEDPKFTAADKMFRLTSNQVMLHVLDRIDERYGHITALSLQQNRLALLDCTSMLLWATKFVKVLDLSNNELSSMKEVEKLRGLPLEMIFLQGNKLCDGFTVFSDYVSAIQAIFPRVSRIDGIEVAPKVTGNDPTSMGNVPSYKASFAGSDPSVQGLIHKFLTEFFELYDSANPLLDRKNLSPAYHPEESVFTLTMTKLATPGGRFATFRNEEHFLQYLRQSHNLLQIEKWANRRAERVHYGAMTIAVALAKLPRTKHYFDSFTIDVTLVMPELMSFVVSGLFEEGVISETKPELKYFCRQFIVAPSSASSIVVLSDMLFISPLQPDRTESLHLLKKEGERNGAVAAVATTFSNVPEDSIKQAMMTQLMQQTGMNTVWAEKCLVESNWNFEAAAAAFGQLRGQIPPEAFS